MPLADFGSPVYVHWFLLPQILLHDLAFQSSDFEHILFFMLLCAYKYIQSVHVMFRFNNHY